MKIIKYIFCICTFLVACKVDKNEQITVQGNLINERTGAPFNPFSNAIVRLVLDEGYGYSKELGTAKVESNGSYKIVSTYSKTNIKARLQLVKNEAGEYNIDDFVMLENETYHDFLIECSVNLKRVFFQQPTSTADSIVLWIANSKGTNKFVVQRKAYNYFLFDNRSAIKGDEKNFMSSYIYSAGLYTQYNDTIYSGCRTTINDTIVF